MRFTLASAASILAFTATTLADDQKSYLQAGTNEEYLSASIAIDGFTHYALLTDAKSATPAIITGQGGELQVDLSSISGAGVTGLLTLEDKEGYSGLKHAIFGNPSVVTASSGWDFPSTYGNLTSSLDAFHGWYACFAAVGVKQLYWSDWANYNGSAPTNCEKVTLHRVFM
ncbi:hypothetical protein BGW36DRAFT_365008 [Talaromyces proteolyticus]|uniref:DUF7907 domain-containing protein n=1 Tax=Talaromyces proteolyticus TaxID=1131652 RepID=A0AAD4KEV2_9EURO|nr:uncharacterized protein BGW36DRAFT_365008 [Talaromyces proteolyticus]KAH8690288.1 hypothetical protein BGW36DRAFT_365008 [Talaromyces proteolyticus]